MNNAQIVELLRAVKIIRQENQLLTAEIAKLQTAMIIIGAFAEALTIYAFVTVFLLMGKLA